MSGVAVNTHAQLIQDAIHDAMKRNLPQKGNGPRSSCISEEVWRMRNLEQELKRKTAGRKSGRRQSALREAFEVFRHNCAGHGTRTMLIGQSAVMCETVAGAIPFANRYMKQRVRKDRTTSLQIMVSKSGIARADDILGTLNRMQLGAKKPKSWQQALPELRKPDGSRPHGRQDLDQLWLDHFSTLELGDVKPAAFYCAAKPADPCQDYDPDLGAMLSLTEIKASLRACKPRKSTGLDNYVPGEILRAAPAQFAAIYQALMLKAVMHVKQPVQ